MQNSALFLRFLQVFLCGFSGCVGACARSTDNDPSVQLTSSSAQAAPSASPPSGLVRNPGDNPFGFGSGPSPGRPGDYALVPSKSSLEGAFAEVKAARTLFYSGAWVEEVHERETRVRWLTQQRGTIPNALVITIESGATAHPGDVVLTSGPGGSGLLRAFVVGGARESPKVRALDAAGADFDLPSAEPQLLPKATFRVLRKAGEIGTSMVCRSGDRLLGMILLSRFQDRVLGLGFAGTTEAFAASSCQPLPLVRTLAPGTRIYVPQLDRLVEAQVVSVRAETGRVSAKFTFAGVERTAEVGMLNLATELP